MFLYFKVTRDDNGFSFIVLHMNDQPLGNAHISVTYVEADAMRAILHHATATCIATDILRFVDVCEDALPQDSIGSSARRLVHTIVSRD